MSWEKVKLGDIADVTSSKRVFANQYVDKGIPFYRQKEIIERNNKQEISDPLFISQDLYDDIKKKYGVPQKNDLLITGVGATLGIPYVIGNETFYFKDGNLIWVKNFSSKADSKYIYYYMSSDAGQKAMWSRTIGAAQPALTIDIVKQYEIPLPDIKLQKRIADILSAYDNLIENNQKQIKLLEEAAQRLYKQWFIDLRYPGHETTPIVNGLPKGWRKDTVDSIVSLLSGFAFKSNSFSENGVFKIVTIKNVQDGIFDGENVSLIDELPAKMSEHCILNSGDILLSLTGNVGRVCMVVGENYLLNQRVAKLKSDYPSFTYCLFRSKDMFDEMNNLANGAAQQNLSPIRTGQIKITVPSADILKMFENRISPLISRMLILWKQNKYLIQFRNRLLPKLMNGEILA